MNKRLVYVFLTMLLFMSGCDNKNSITSLDNDEQDVYDLLQKAKTSANNEYFSNAKEALEEARKISGGKSEEYQKTATYVSQKQQEYDNRIEQQKREEEIQRQAKLAAEEASRQASSGGYSSGGNVEYIIVDADCVGGFFSFCQVKNLSISGGPGNFRSQGSKSGVIVKGYNGQLAGRYQFSITLDNKVCSGSISISDSHQNVGIRVYADSCNDAGSYSF